MVGILKISEGAQIALRAALHLAKEGEQPTTTQQAARALKVSAAHLSKILQNLARAGIVRAVRGRLGGFVLERPLAEIRVIEVLECIEGPLRLGKSRLLRCACAEGGCPVEAALDAISAGVVRGLGLRLSEL